MPHFFISYSKKDTRELALALNDALNALPDVTAWVDRSLKAGHSWETQIQSEIRRCDFFVVLYSPDINRHLDGEEESYVLNEIGYAKRTVKKPIIPVMAQKTDPPMSLTNDHYIDYTIAGLILSDLVEAIGEEAGINTAAAPDKISEVDSVGGHQLTGKPAPPTNPHLKDFADPVRQIIGEPFDWCKVPAGAFLMGSDRKKDKTAFDNELELQEVTVPGFTISKYLITYSQFQRFIEAEDGIREDRWWSKLGVDFHMPTHQYWKVPDYPRESVNWYQAMAFCRWLSHRLGGGYAMDDISAWRVRLPMEAEWEKAARGTKGRIFPWGDTFDAEHCNAYDSGIKRTSPVTQYPSGASPYGAQDMSGNVWEWCLSEYKNPYRPHSAKQVQINNNSRVIRGGSYGDEVNALRTANRYNSLPDASFFYLGFRIVGVLPTIQ